MREIPRILAAILIFTACLRAQTTQPVDNAAPMIESRIAELEAQIGSLMQKRVDNSQGSPRELELRIDARLVARWLLSRAADAPVASDLRNSAWIRASDVLAAVSLVEKELDANNRAAGPNPAAAKALNDVTFKLADMKSPEQMDSVCRTAANAMLPANDSAGLPVMRPPIKIEAVGGRNVEQLAGRARELTVSAALRSQLQALSQLAVQISQDPKRQRELPPIRDALDAGVALAEGLQVNTAVEREDRVQMEAQIAQGLAMAIDPRTRELGQKRVAALGQYRALLSRLREMKLPADLLKRFGAALTWAQQNPKSADELVAALEQFLTQDARLSVNAGKGELPPLYAKPAEDARRRAAAAREAFIDAAASPAQFRRPANLHRQAEIMRKAMDARAAIARMPEVMKIIAALRPKPFGGIEKRVQSALAAWQPDTREPERDGATEFLIRLTQLADAASQGNDAIPAKYAGASLDAFRAKRKSALSEVVNSVAAGGKLDDAAISPLERSRSLIESAKLASRAEAAVTNADVLQRWVDWGVTAEQLETLFTPYREAMAVTFKAYAEADLYQLEQWELTRKPYEPVLTLLARIAERTEECRPLPGGRAGLAAKLATPVVGQPYSGIRAARVGFDVWHQSHVTKDDKRAAAALEALGRAPIAD